MGARFQKNPAGLKNGNHHPEPYERLCAKVGSGIEGWEVSVNKGLLRLILSGNIPSGTLVKRDFAMSNALIDSLETRVNHAVETIESLKSENLALREDRQILEDKLRELLGKFEGVEASDALDASDDSYTPSDSAPGSDATENSAENSVENSADNSSAESPYGMGNPGRGGNSSPSEY